MNKTKVLKVVSKACIVAGNLGLATYHILANEEKTNEVIKIISKVVKVKGS